MKFNKKKIVLLTSLALSSQAFAATVYENDTMKVDISGAFLMDYWKPVHLLDDHDFNTSRSTLGFGVEQQLGNGWSGDVKFEWDNLTSAPSDESGTKSDDQFRTRLGYFSIHNEELGSLRFGKQYSVYHDVAGYMDNLIVFDPDATPLFSDGKDGGFMATARGDDLVTYRKSFDNLNLSVQHGFKGVQNTSQDVKRDSNYALAASYDFDNGISLGATHMVNKIKTTAGTMNLEASDEQKITTVAVKYSYEAFKVAAAYTDGTKAHETDLLAYSFNAADPNTPLKTNKYADAEGMDIYAEYYFAIGLRPYVYLSNVDFDDGSIQGERSIYSMGLSYHAAPNFIISGEVRKTSEEDVDLAGKHEDTLTGITVIYAF
ncbi:porin [Vibrio sp. 404]|uniref:Porin n=1 Tax=Vibrio marinisediminis TaxID=2758441 RepID=A0A7W2IVR0_9VIBR|nr:porin [Vibrio marinisediminis]MBA5764287.1 porin [Vibrio marinisediminis]